MDHRAIKIKDFVVLANKYHQQQRLCVLFLFMSYNLIVIHRIVYDNGIHKLKLVLQIHVTCTLNTCSKITTQNIFITVANCYWSFNTNTCQTLSSCDDLIFKVSAVGCAAQSLSCAGYEKSKCINTSTISSTCSSQQQQINCSQFISSQGLFVLNNSNYSCSLLQYCNQITDATICGNWLNLCMWDAKISQCQQLACSTISNKQSCTYVLYQFQSTQYQFCRQNNSIGPQGACENAYSALLQTSQTCLNYTGNTFRWSANNKSAGMCVSCGTIQLQLQTSNCQAFTNCSSLTATNQIECINMNASCKGISYGNFQSFPTQTCSILYTTSEQNFLKCFTILFIIYKKILESQTNSVTKIQDKNQKKKDQNQIYPNPIIHKLEVYYN